VHRSVTPIWDDTEFARLHAAIRLVLPTAGRAISRGGDGGVGDAVAATLPTARRASRRASSHR